MLDTKKRGLVLSGGGSRGAFQVGVIKALLEKGYNWQYITGVSVGALNGCWLAMFKPEEQSENFAKLEEFWSSIKNNEDVYKPWLPWIFTYIPSLWKGSINSNKPLKDLINNNWKQEKVQNSGIKFEVGAVSLKTGKYATTNQDNKNLLDWILASSCYPVAFPPVKINNELYVDGGIRNSIPINDIFKYQPDEIDVILTSPINGYIQEKTDIKSSIMIGLRCAEIMSDEVTITDIKLKCNQPKINIFAPQEPVNNDSLEFNQKEIKQNIQNGYNYTLKLLGQ